jgi:hypothetical protein
MLWHSFVHSCGVSGGKLVSGLSGLAVEQPAARKTATTMSFMIPPGF